MCSIYSLHWKINHTQRDNPKDVDVVMPIYNLIEYDDNYSKTSGQSWQYYKDEIFLVADGAIADFSADDDNSASLEFKQKITTET